MKKKQAISLIVLVITIIVMIILAGSIILTLSNRGIISKANDAVTATDLANMQDLATMLWADAYLDGKSGDDLVSEVQDGLYEADKNYAIKYDVIITDTGVTVRIKGVEDEPNDEDETITQLSKPTITISENTLVIVDNATNGSNTAGFEIYVESEKKATITSTTYDLTTLELAAGTYSITVKAVAEESSTILASELSEAVTYTVTATSASTLGTLVASAENYGDAVNYTVTVNAGETTETTIDDWRVFYKQTVNNEEYVYLIASEKLAANAIPTNIPEATISGQNIYWADGSAPSTAGTIQNPTLWLANWSNYSTNENGRCVSYFLDETYWESFKNTAYGDYVVGAIGTPTGEMFIASWNAKREATGDTTTYNKKLSLVANGTTGYYVNDITTSDPASSNTLFQTIATTDDLYIWSTSSGTSVWLASPSGGNTYYLPSAVSDGGTYYEHYSVRHYGVRPVVCLKSSIPAYEQGEGDAKTIVLDVN